MSQNYHLMNDANEQRNTKSDPKMKFLDDLFEDKNSRCPRNNSQSKTLLVKSKVESTGAEYSNQGKKIGPILSAKIFIGLLMSFFFLSYVFKFNLMIIVPLTLISLFIYLVKSNGNRNYHHHVKSIRKGFKSIINKFKNRNSDASIMEKSLRDYMLLK